MLLLRTQRLPESVCLSDRDKFKVAEYLPVCIFIQFSPMHEGIYGEGNANATAEGPGFESRIG